MPPRNPSRPGRTRRRADVRAGDIVTAASRLFAARGFRRTTVAAVADEVGLSDAGVLHHFPTKDALLAAVLDRIDRTQAMQFLELLEPGGLEGLRNLARWGDVMAADPHLLGLHITLTAEAIEATADLHDYFVQRYRIVRRWMLDTFREGIDTGDIRTDVDVDHEVTAFIAFLDGVRVQWFFARHHVSLADAVRTYIDALIARIAISSTPRRARDM